MTTIIVEDGTGVTNANSYVSTAELQSFFEIFGQALPENIADIAVRSCMYVDMQSDCWPGRRSHATQSLVWPRTGVYLESAFEPIDPESIPGDIKKAQMFAALAAAQGINLFPTYDPTAGVGEVKREEIGPLKTEYFGVDPNLYGTKTKLPAVSGLLDPFLRQSCGGGQFRTLRV